MAESRDEPGGEPVWLVRTIIVLFFLAFVGFLAREVRNIVERLS